MSSKAKREEEIKEFMQAAELVFSEKAQRLYQYFNSQSLTPGERARVGEFWHRVNQPLPGLSSAVKTSNASAITSPTQESTATSKAVVGPRSPGTMEGVAVVIPERTITLSQVSTTPNDDHSGAEIGIHRISTTVSPTESITGDTSYHDFIDDGPLNDLAYSPEVDTSNRSEELTQRATTKRKRGQVDDSNLSEELTTTKRRRGRPLKDPQSNSGGPHNYSWQPMIEISDIQLQPKFERLIRNKSDESGAEMATSVFARCGTQCVPIIQYDQPNDETLAKLCLEIINLSPKKQTKRTVSQTFTLFEHLAWCFHTLAVGDLVVKRFGEEVTLRSKISTRKRLEDEVAKQDRSSVAQGLTVACNMFFVCREFGVGTIFFFAMDLRRHFLVNLVTKRGEKFDATKRNFATHGFNKLIDDSGATKVGAAVRTHLQVIYKLDQIERESDSSDESDVGSETSNQSNPDEEIGTADRSSIREQENGDSYIDEMNSSQ